MSEQERTSPATESTLQLLSVEQLAGELRQLAEWQLIEEGRAISRIFRFANYYQTIAFVNAVAWIAHREDHHPDLGVHYNRCHVRLSTHEAGGVTRRDLRCAGLIEALLGNVGG